MKSLAALALLIPSLAIAAAFPRDLSVGSHGEDVLALQKLLNRDPASQVALAGPGSPGNESSYFGPATKAAVIRFQEKYATSILVPNGLIAGTGRVGASTRAVLETFLQAPATSTAVAPTAPAASSAPVVSNPNLKNADLMLAAIEQTASGKGYSSQEISDMKTAVLKELATTTDLHALLLKQIESSRTAETGYVGKLVAAVQDLIGVRHAEAGLGIPFGGTILVQVFCNQSGNWMLTLKPVGPTYATLLSYYMGTELFSYYNLPFALFVKGFYSPPGMCTIGACPYCVHIPTWGTITPEVGSSLLP